MEINNVFTKLFVDTQFIDIKIPKFLGFGILFVTQVTSMALPNTLPYRPDTYTALPERRGTEQVCSWGSACMNCAASALSLMK